MTELPDFSTIDGFDWDKNNVQKNWKRHRVAFYECEEVLMSEPIVVPDHEHSQTEPRFLALGKTMQDRLLAVFFTVRKNKFRVISARDMSRKERRDYEQD